MSELDRGREAYAQRSWRQAYDALTEADRAEAIDVEDLERLAIAAYLLALDDDSVAYLDRLYHVHVDATRHLQAARCAFWAGMQLFTRGELGPGGGWLARAHRLLEHEEQETAEHGLLLLPLALEQQASGNPEVALETARRATEIGQRFGDGELFGLAALMQGRLLTDEGRVADGMRLLDEAMLAATSEGQSPIVTGLVYCGVILACVETYDVRRAREWTEVLTRWCGDQPELVAFTGRCLVHRSEILQLGGHWGDALAEAQRAGDRLTKGFNGPATAQAFYRQGELHRLRGDPAAAEQAYRAASRYGFEPQPGFALLRLAQGRADAAAGGIRRVLAETAESYRRVGFLPAYVEIAIELGELQSALDACVELEEIATTFRSELLEATAASARGALRLAEDDAAGALESLRRARRAWHELAAPYEAARTQELIGLACRRLEDADGAALELEGARDTFAELGAAPDAARVSALLGATESGGRHGLTARELEVLRLVAAGRSNKQIAAALVISEHTVARHVQNIFAKVGVSSRTAASAFAYEHDLV